jgi:hypothetical protein
MTLDQVIENVKKTTSKFVIILGDVYSRMGLKLDGMQGKEQAEAARKQIYDELKARGWIQNPNHDAVRAFLKEEYALDYGPSQIQELFRSFKH